MLDYRYFLLAESMGHNHMTIRFAHKIAFFRLAALSVGLAMLPLYLLWPVSPAPPTDAEINLPTYGSAPPLRQELPIYRFAVHPLHNPQRLFVNFQPIIDIINREAKDFSVRLIAARDYQSFEKRILMQEFDLILGNPLQTVWSLGYGYRVVGKMGDDDRFYGIIIARDDFVPTNAAALVGYNMVFPAPTALAATLMPRLYLHEQGADFSQINIIYSGSQESAIMNVYLGKADLAGTWPMPWKLFLKERPELGRRLHVVWRTPPLVNNGIAIRTGMPEAHVQHIMNILLGLPASPEGRAILQRLSISGFEASNNDDYVKPVRNFMECYRKAFPNEERHLDERQQS